MSKVCYMNKTWQLFLLKRLGSFTGNQFNLQLWTLDNALSEDVQVSCLASGFQISGLLKDVWGTLKFWFQQIDIIDNIDIKRLKTKLCFHFPHWTGLCWQMNHIYTQHKPLSDMIENWKLSFQSWSNNNKIIKNASKYPKYIYHGNKKT